MQFSCWNEATKAILAPTHGIIVYQEQDIKLVQIVANFDPAKSDNLRRAISKKDEKTIKSMNEEFIAGAIANGFSYDLANQIFLYIYEFANYGFNHSHSLAYAYLSYYLAYLKHYYPIEFMTVLLSNFATHETREKLLIILKNKRL